MSRFTMSDLDRELGLGGSATATADEPPPTEPKRFTMADLDAELGVADAVPRGTPGGLPNIGGAAAVGTLNLAGDIAAGGGVVASEAVKRVPSVPGLIKGAMFGQAGRKLQSVGVDNPFADYGDQTVMAAVDAAERREPAASMIETMANANRAQIQSFADAVGYERSPGIAGVVEDVAGAVPHFAGGIATTAGGTVVGGPLVGLMAGAAYFGATESLSKAAQIRDTLIRQGMDPEEARAGAAAGAGLYGAASGALEFVGLAPMLRATRFFKHLDGVVAKSAARRVGARVAGVLGAGLGEAVTEDAQSIVGAATTDWLSTKEGWGELQRYWNDLDARGRQALVSSILGASVRGGVELWNPTEYGSLEEAVGAVELEPVAPQPPPETAPRTDATAVVESPESPPQQPVQETPSPAQSTPVRIVLKGSSVAPKPDSTLTDGTMLFQGKDARGRAEQMVRFRNERLGPQDAPLRALEMLPGAEGSPWAVGYEMGKVPERQTAEVTEFARVKSREVAPKSVPTLKLADAETAPEPAPPPIAEEERDAKFNRLRAEGLEIQADARLLKEERLWRKAVDTPGDLVDTEPHSNRQFVGGRVITPLSEGVGGRILVEFETKIDGEDMTVQQWVDPLDLKPHEEAPPPTLRMPTVSSPSTSQPPTPEGSREAIPTPTSKTQISKLARRVVKDGLDETAARAALAPDQVEAFERDLNAIRNPRGPQPEPPSPIEAAQKAMRPGWSIDHESDSGSVYLKHDESGKIIRVSDHAVPEQYIGIENVRAAKQPWVRDVVSRHRLNDGMVSQAMDEVEAEVTVEAPKPPVASMTRADLLTEATALGVDAGPKSRPALAKRVEAARGKQTQPPSGIAPPAPTPEPTAPTAAPETPPRTRRPRAQKAPSPEPSAPQRTPALPVSSPGTASSQSTTHRDAHTEDAAQRMVEMPPNRGMTPLVYGREDVVAFRPGVTTMEPPPSLRGKVPNNFIDLVETKTERGLRRVLLFWRNGARQPGTPEALIGSDGGVGMPVLGGVVIRDDMAEAIWVSADTRGASIVGKKPSRVLFEYLDEIGVKFDPESPRSASFNASQRRFAEAEPLPPMPGGGRTIPVNEMDRAAALAEAERLGVAEGPKSAPALRKRIEEARAKGETAPQAEAGGVERAETIEETGKKGTRLPRRPHILGADAVLGDINAQAGGTVRTADWLLKLHAADPAIKSGLYTADIEGGDIVIRTGDATYRVRADQFNLDTDSIGGAVEFDFDAIRDVKNRRAELNKLTVEKLIEKLDTGGLVMGRSNKPGLVDAVMRQERGLPPQSNQKDLRRKTVTQRLLDIAAGMEADAKAANAKINIPRGRNIGATLPPAYYANLVKIGAAKILKGTVKFAEWSAQMIEAEGQWIADSIRDLWADSQSLAEDIQDGTETETPTTERITKRVEARRQAETESTSARKADIAREREAMGLDTLDSPARRSWQAALDEADTRGLSDIHRAMQLSAEAINAPRAFSDVETAGLVKAMARLKGEHRDLVARINAETDPVVKGSLVAQMYALEQQYDVLTRGLDKSGTEKGRALNAQKLTLDADLSLIAVRSRARAAKGTELTAEESAAFEKLTAERDAAVAKSEALEAELKNAMAQKAVHQHAAETVAGRKRNPVSREAAFEAKVARARELLKKGCR